MLNRRKFLSVIGGAVAAVAGGLTAIATGRPTRPALPNPWHKFMAQFPRADKAELLPKMRTAFRSAKAEWKPPLNRDCWPQEYSLAVKLPQPKNRPTQAMAGLSYWIDRPTEIVKCQHLGLGFYAGEHRGMRLRAIAERRDGKLFCTHSAWDGEWNAPEESGIGRKIPGYDPDRRQYLALDKEGLVWVTRGDA